MIKCSKCENKGYYEENIFKNTEHVNPLFLKFSCPDCERRKAVKKAVNKAKEFYDTLSARGKEKFWEYFYEYRGDSGLRKHDFDRDWDERNIRGVGPKEET